MLAEPQTQNAIIPALDARKVAEWAKLIQQSIVEIRKTVLHEGSDYGKIPGTNKDVLLKPGAEKMSSAFKLYPVPKLLTGVEDWKDGFFFYRYQIDMIHRETGEVWGSGIGSCNSREKKYAWRWVTESELPAGMDKDSLLKEDGMQTLTEFDFAVKEAKTGGQWGKPAEYWQQFKDAIEAGKAKKIQKETKRGKSDAWEITTGVARYRIPNPEICDLVNTIDKMAYKRAYVAAVLIATNASEFFTQDMEDFMSLALPDEDNVVEGVVVDVTAPAAEKPAEPPQQEEKKPDAPRMASCLATDAKCQADFRALRKELGIVNDSRYLEYMQIKQYSDYTGVDGTFENLCMAVRNLHARFKQEDAQLEADIAAKAAADLPAEQVAKTLAGDHSRIGANPTDTPAVTSNGDTGAAGGSAVNDDIPTGGNMNPHHPKHTMLPKMPPITEVQR